MGLKIVQIGSNKGNDELSQYIFDNFKKIEFGLFVEANSFHIEELKKCYENYENIIVENIAIKDPSYSEDNITIYYHTNEYPHYGIASSNIKHLEKHMEWCPHLQGGQIESFNVSCITLDELFQKYSICDLDILFLDIEGIDAEVLLSFDWARYSIKRVEFEYIHLGEHETYIKKMFNDMGYSQVDSLHEYNWAFEKNKDLKVLFFGRNSREDVWEYDFILNDILPKDYFKRTHFLSLDEVRNSSDTFDVFVYSARDPNIYSWGYTPTYDEVLECVLKTKPKVVIQLSDEYKDEDLEHYNQLSDYCELFLRQYNHQEYRNSKFKTNVPNDNIVYIPLGYCNGTPVDKIKTVPSSEKKYNWSFIGKIKDWEFCFFDNVKQKWVSVGDRTEMTETFKSNIQDFFFAQEGIDKDELIRIYSNSIFVPCGKGNSSLDCFRLYEASMCGAISVVVGSFGEIENTFRYEENPPWVFAESWDQAVEKCKDLLNNKDHLQEIQNNLLDWWSNRIHKIQDKVNEVFVETECKDHSYKLYNFPPINFISVDKSEDRRKLLYEKFAKYNMTNIRPHIFEVYNDEDHNYIGESFRQLNGMGRGPTTSHLKAIKDWYFDTEEEYAFFCEDDISFDTVKYWNFTWEEFFNSLPKDWECIQLCWVRENDMFVFSNNGVKLRHRCWCDWSACAYLIKRSHAKKLISNYYRNGSFNLDFVGNDSHVRPQWAKNPVAETIVFSPLGNPKDSNVNVSPIYGFPLFVEDVYNCESCLLKYDDLNILNHQRVINEMSYDTIVKWWETEGKNLKIEDIIDI
jgi:FkbM family methyltransferase